MPNVHSGNIETNELEPEQEIGRVSIYTYGYTSTLVQWYIDFWNISNTSCSTWYPHSLVISFKTSFLWGPNPAKMNFISIRKAFAHTLLHSKRKWFWQLMWHWLREGRVAIKKSAWEHFICSTYVHVATQLICTALTPLLHLNFLRAWITENGDFQTINYN